MRDIVLSLKDNSTVTLDAPEPGGGASCFLVSLPKAGSTLFYRIMKSICDRSDLSFVSWPNKLRSLGILPKDIATNFQSIYQPVGYAYGGYRGADIGFPLPAFASGRTVMLIRDPRDMLTSQYFSEAASHVEPGTAVSQSAMKEFEARRLTAQALTIDEYVLKRSSSVLSGYERTLQSLHSIEHLLFRYEDVIFDKLRWIEKVVGYLGLSVPPRQLAAIVARNDIIPAVEDTTKHVRQVSPGNYRQKLQPETIDELNRTFAGILARFGYAEGSDAIGQSAPRQPAPADRGAKGSPAAPDPAAAAAAREARLAARREERRNERQTAREAERAATAAARGVPIPEKMDLVRARREPIE